MGCPIRRSEDPRALAPPLGFSQRATSFIASRCQGIHQMPFSELAHAQPQARAAKRRDQRSEVRRQHRPGRDLACCTSVTAAGSQARTSLRRACAPAYCIPMPRPSPDRPDGWPACFTVTTRFTMSKNRGQRAEDRPRRSIAPISAANSRSRCQKTRRRRPSDPPVLCPLSSEPGGPGPTRTADLTLIRRAL